MSDAAEIARLRWALEQIAAGFPATLQEAVHLSREALAPSESTQETIVEKQRVAQ